MSAVPISAEELACLLERLDTRCARWPHQTHPSMVRCSACTGCHAHRLAVRLVQQGPNQ